MRGARFVTVIAILVACKGNDDASPVPSNDAGTDAAIDGSEASPIDAADAGGPCGELSSTWKRCPQNPLLTGWRPGPTAGKFEWTFADPSVLYDESDSKWKAWWSTVIVAACADVTDLAKREVSTKYAESNDGFSWTVAPDLALGSRRGPTTWDDTTVETPSVIKVNGNPADRRYVMVYAGGNDALGKFLGQTPWQLGLAFSADGKHFTRLPASESPYAGKDTTPYTDHEGLILLGRDAFPAFPTVVNGIVADPEIVEHEGVFHLWFSSAGIDKDGKVPADGTGTKVAYGIGHATSSDLVHWKMQTDNPVIVGGGQPSVVIDATNGFEMWFGRDSKEDVASIPSALFPTLGFWHATSKDGLVWSSPSARDFTWDKSFASEELGLINGPAVVRRGAEYRLYFGAWTATKVPSGSCAYVQSAGVISSTSGAFTLDVAMKK